MIALFFTFFITAYLLGPDLLSRFVLGFVCPSKVLDQSKSEEFTRATAWAVLPMIFSVAWARWLGKLSACAGMTEWKVLLSFLYSPGSFPRTRETELLNALSGLFWWNVCILWRLYLLVFLFWVAVDFAIHKYGRIRRRGQTSTGFRVLRHFLELFVLPRVAYWHLYLSHMLAEYKDIEVYADILTTKDVMYKGKVARKELGSDGTLAAITLATPSRFRREHYMKAKEADPATKPDVYWVPVPGDMFVIPGSGISTINIRQSSSQSVNDDAATLAKIRVLLSGSA